MQIVISISDSYYDRLKDMNIEKDTCSFNESALVEVIKNGTPLSEFCEDCIIRQAVCRQPACGDCVYYGKLSLECSRCDDSCSMYKQREG